jgi:hypothetical protein
MPDGTEIPAIGNAAELPAVSVITVTRGRVARQHDYARHACHVESTGG